MSSTILAENFAVENCGAGREENSAAAGDAMLRAILDADAEAAYVRDLEGRCLAANDGMARVLGVPVSELIGRPLARFFSQEAGCAVLAHEEKALADGGRQQCELAIPLAGGERIFEITHGVLRNASGGEWGVLGRMRDVGGRKALEREVVEISERERRRIAMDLHDVLCQDLAAVSLIAHLLQKRLDGEDSTQGKVARHIADMTKRMAVSARKLAHNLAPPDLSGENFVHSLRDAAADLCAAFPLQCGIEGNWPGEGCGAERAMHLYRIAHEAMHNAARHGGAHSITVRLRVSGAAFTLSVSDDGKGFSPEECGVHGMGLHSMQYRASLIGGALAIDSAQGRGTTVVCTVPLEIADRNNNENRGKL